MQRKLESFESWKEAPHNDSTNDDVTSGDAKLLPIPLANEPKSKSNAKTKPIIKSDSKIAGSKPVDADKQAVKSNLKSTHPKQITLLSNQTLHIKSPERV